MRSRDKIFLASGIVVVFAGSIATFAWSISVGLIALLAMSLIILILLLLIRNQLARVQERTLTLLKSRTVQSEVQDQVISQTRIKKVIGLLEAQQMSMELLNKRFGDNK